MKGDNDPRIITGVFSADAQLDELTSFLNRHRIVGQPVITNSMVRATLQCENLVDQGYYDQLTSTRILVVHDQSGDIIGAVAAGDTDDGIRDLLWLCADDTDVIQYLIEAVFKDWNGNARAFEFASTISAGLEGLPRNACSKIHDELLRQGFSGHDLWSYQELDLPSAGDKCDVGFEMKESIANAKGEPVAEYQVGIPFPGVGVIWWISTLKDHRRLGYGRMVLNTAISVLGAHGATRALLYVDDDTPESDRDRRPAKALYATAGFVEVDRLWSYSRRNKQVANLSENGFEAS